MVKHPLILLLSVSTKYELIFLPNSHLGAKPSWLDQRDPSLNPAERKSEETQHNSLGSKPDRRHMKKKMKFSLYKKNSTDKSIPVAWSSSWRYYTLWVTCIGQGCLLVAPYGPWSCRFQFRERRRAQRQKECSRQVRSSNLIGGKKISHVYPG